MKPNFYLPVLAFFLLTISCSEADMISKSPDASEAGTLSSSDTGLTPGNGGDDGGEHQSCIQEQENGMIWIIGTFGQFL